MTLTEPSITQTGSWYVRSNLVRTYFKLEIWEQAPMRMHIHFHQRSKSERLYDLPLPRIAYVFVNRLILRSDSDYTKYLSTSSWEVAYFALRKPLGSEINPEKIPLCALPTHNMYEDGHGCVSREVYRVLSDFASKIDLDVDDVTSVAQTFWMAGLNTDLIPLYSSPHLRIRRLLARHRQKPNWYAYYARWERMRLGQARRWRLHRTPQSVANLIEVPGSVRIAGSLAALGCDLPLKENKRSLPLHDLRW